MTFNERLARIRAGMEDRRLDVLIAVHDGAHFIEKPNPVMVLSGFKSLGPAAALLDRHGGLHLVVTPAWDCERAADACPKCRILGPEDVAAGVIDALSSIGGTAKRGVPAIGIAGLSALPWAMADRLTSALPHGHPADEIVFAPACTKTGEEIAHAREATRIAELGYEHLLRIAKPGMSEDELAAEVRWYTKTLGAEDNFLLLCAGEHNRAVQPSTGRRLKAGDVIVAEITPSYCGQLAQICRTIVLGEASSMLAEKYALVAAAMRRGIDAAAPGVPVSEVCRAIDRVLEAEGYGEYCHPPHIRRRGHGLGFASIRPGDVSLDNHTLLEPEMVFMVHPNQYLPETGYLLCGEPVLVTAQGAEPLTRRPAALAEIH